MPDHTHSMLRVRFDDFDPTLREATTTAGLDPASLTLGVPTLEPNRAWDRTFGAISDGRTAATWKVTALRPLFRGSVVPPSLDSYPQEYQPSFYFIETAVVNFCGLYGPKTDGEFEEVHSNLRRRPDGRSLGLLHDIAWQATALWLAIRPASQAEFEAVFNRLTLAAKHFRLGHASRNYIEHATATVGG